MKKRLLSFWEIWNMSFGFLGIQFGFALQGGFMSRIFQSMGAHEEDIPILWIAAPMTGLIVQPIIGYLSDKTWHPRWTRLEPVQKLLSLLGAAISPNQTLRIHGWVSSCRLTRYMLQKFKMKDFL